jgi:hypothetical protein
MWMGLSSASRIRPCPAPGTVGSTGILAIHGTAVIEKDVISNYYYGVEGLGTSYLSANTISGTALVFALAPVYSRAATVRLRETT